MDNRDNNKKKPNKPTKNNEKMSAIDRAQINELLSESISNYVSRAKKENKNVEEAVERINAYLSEYLQAFMIFGYDMSGNPVCIHNATNQMDADALNSLINRALFKGID